MIKDQLKSQNQKQLLKNQESQRFEYIQNPQFTSTRQDRIINIQNQNQNNSQQIDEYSSEKQSLNNSKVNKTSRKIIQWSSQEDEILFEKYFQMGPKWVELSTYFPQKCDNAVKNRFYSCLKKTHRKINIVQKTRKLKHRKLISFESLLTLLEIKKNKNNSLDKRFEQITKYQNEIMEVINLIVQLAKIPEEEMDDNNVEIAIRKYIQIRHALKFINSKRAKKVGKKAENTKSISNCIQSTIEYNQERDKTSKENQGGVYRFQLINDLITDNKEIEAILKLVQKNGVKQNKDNLLEDYKDIIHFKQQKQQKQDFENLYFF